MKPAVAVALIISGTILLLAPYASNAIRTSQLAMVMASNHQPEFLRGEMPVFYDILCVIAALAMVLTGVVASLRRNA